jgi:NAD-dependent SIR2 family protein deacetylase
MKLKKKRPGRRAPYTERGIRRLRCVRCGEQASQQWRACADGLWRPICTDCDVLLNRLALFFMADPEAEEKIDRYMEQQLLKPKLRQTRVCRSRS